MSATRLTNDVQDLLDRATALSAAGDHAGALKVLADAKSARRPMRGIDALRARCFEALGDRHSAEQARREEARWFDATNVDDIEPRPLDAIESDDDWFAAALECVRPFTMLSEKRLRSLHDLARTVLQARVGGDFVECGVAAGGSSALLAACIRRYGHGRHLWCFDTFTGMPEPTAEDVDRNGQHADASGWGTGTCSAPEASLRAAARLVGAEDRLVLQRGLFQDTLPTAAPRIGRIALLHLDGDWYESTRVCFEWLWDRVAAGGALQIDDYGHWQGCQRATDEFLAARGVRPTFTKIDYTGVSFRKPEGRER
ncbi:MAG: class I SAM-dependent methyltransferase [Phycisphaerae bacterium]|nr:class I SAM-dependent methyltransferase [Phycisphaerae bacterium]